MRTPFQGKGTTMQRMDEESAERRKKRRKRMIEVSGIQKEKRKRKRERGE